MSQSHLPCSRHRYHLARQFSQTNYDSEIAAYTPVSLLLSMSLSLGISLKQQYPTHPCCHCKRIRNTGWAGNPGRIELYEELSRQDLLLQATCKFTSPLRPCTRLNIYSDRCISINSPLPEVDNSRGSTTTPAAICHSSLSIDTLSNKRCVVRPSYHSVRGE